MKNPFFWKYIEIEGLDHFSKELKYFSSDIALRELAQAIAHDAGFIGSTETVLIVTTKPKPILSIVTEKDDDISHWISVQDKAINWACSNLRYINYEQIEKGCELLAENLINRFDILSLLDFSYIALPRGGYVILGLMSYYLNLKSDQTEKPTVSEIPLVVFDDCALTGARFGEYLRQSDSKQIIFAPLFSNPELRKAIKNQEPRVLECMSAYDIPERLGALKDWQQETWISRMGGKQYWIGKLEHVCFPWNEPDISVWNPVKQKMERGFRIVSPQHCIKNRLLPGQKSVPIQVQPEGKGPIKPSDKIVFGKFKGLVIVGNIETGECFTFSETGSVIWNAVIAYGNIVSVISELFKYYDVNKSDLRADIEAFIDDLIRRGLLEDWTVCVESN